MSKNLGSYIRFIPEVDQDTLVTALAVFGRKGVHRGMLAFIPIDELIKSLRTMAMGSLYGYAQAQYAQAQAAQQFGMANHPSQQQNLYGTGLPGYVGGGGTTTSGYTGTSTSNAYNIPMPVSGLAQGSALGLGLGGTYIPPNSSLEQQCLFAYASLMTAIGFMRIQEERDSETECPEKVEKNEKVVAFA